MYNTGILSTFSRLMVNNILVPSRNISINAPLNINITNVLFAEPLKKKKRLDPALIKAKEERRRKKLEKSIRRLEKHARQLKPIAELEVSRKLKNEIELRKRNLPPPTPEQILERAKLLKEWNAYKTKEHKETLNLINTLIEQQEKALAELKSCSEELYLSAIQIDPDLLPFSTKGPVSTPPIEDYEAPDGEYIDITKKYEGET